ncbi:UNVERIFIED_CONTAM: sushi domain (scr repeat) domain-containing protein [Hammondia hammondi]|eukprot:XP_008885323.1 sushi domain (scr repeat) domain-containing protein [Hammondia hammondi]
MAQGTSRRQLQHGRADSHPLKNQSDVGKRLLELSACEVDTDCFGQGRRCVERRCWGFAGPESRRFLCRMGEQCNLALKGHFYGTADERADAVFAVSIVEGNDFSVCGVSGVRGKGTHQEPGFPYVAVSTPYKIQQASRSQALDNREVSFTPENFLLLDDEGASQATEDSNVCREPGSNNSDCPLPFAGPEVILKEGVSLRDDRTIFSSYIASEAEMTTEDVFFSTKYDDTHGNSTIPLQVGTAVNCTYASTDFRPGGYCLAKFGLVVPRNNVGPGTFTICGCSGTDLTNSGVPCSDVSDFAVPIGRLVIAGFDVHQTHEEQEDEQHREERELLLLENRSDESFSLSETANREGVSGLRRRAKKDGSPEDVANTRGLVEPFEDVASRTFSEGSEHDKNARIFPGSLTSRSPRTFTCRFGSVCELAKMHGVGLDSGAFYVHAFRGERRDRCDVLRSKSQLSQRDHPIRLPCKTYAGGSYCVVSARPAAMAALAASSKYPDFGSRPLAENEASPQKNSLSSSSRSDVFTDMHNSGGSNEEAHIEDAQKDRRSVTMTDSEKVPLRTDTEGGETPRVASHSELEPTVLRRLDAPVSPSVVGEFEDEHLPSSSRRKTQTAAGFSRGVGTANNGNKVEDTRFYSDDDGDAAQTREDEGTPGIASATLCSEIQWQVAKRKKEVLLSRKHREVSSAVDWNEDLSLPTPSQWRLLQYITGPAANGQATADGKRTDGRLADECRVNTDCFSGMGVCDKGRCFGFLPDKQDSRLFRCVEGYWCDVKPGDIPGKGITEKYEVIATTPSEPCGTARNLKPTGRLGVQECLTNAHCADNAFAYCIEDHCGGFLVSAAAAGVNAFTCIRNQQCTLQSIAAKSVDQALKVIPVAANFSCGAEAALDPEYVKASALPCIADVNNDGVCDINLGVNRALGTTRLCGCSGQDVGGNGKTCDEASDFDRDLGLVANVQCIVNQDCPSNALCAKGECVEDDMDPYIVSMSPMNDTFSVPPLTYIDLVFNENIKFGRPGAAILIAVTTRKSGRTTSGADPSASTLQYLITLPNNASSLRKISAPFLPAAASASSRLTIHAVGLGEERRRTEAKASSSAFGKHGRDNAEEDSHSDQASLFTGFGTTPGGAQQVGNGGTVLSSTSHSNKWTVEIIGQKLRITPDKDATSLPLGDYRLGIEFGFVTDLIGNMNKGESNLTFTLATDANCPFLYVTGFTTENGNCNGLYMPADPMNDQASWQGGEKNAFFIYWKKEVREGGKVQQGGNWIIDTNYDESSFLAFADLTEHADKKGGKSRAHPPSGLWHKWTGSNRRPQPHISMFCSSLPDRSPASLTSVDPLIGSSLPLSASSLLPLRPITLTFNKPMNFGHWATIKLIPRSAEKRADGGRGVAGEKAGDRRRDEKGVIVWVPDVEGNMRGETIKIFNRPAREVLARSLAAPRPLPPVLSLASLEQGDETGKHSKLLGSWTLLRASAGRRLQANAVESPPPSLARTSPEKLVGVVELHVTEPLIPGETYDLVAELGSLTDLAYNPWGPVEKGTLVFHTTGGRCASKISDGNLVFLPSSLSSLSSLSSSPSTSAAFFGPSGEREGSEGVEEGGFFLAEKGREVVGLRKGAEKDGADDGTQVRVVCRRGFSVHASLKGSKEAEETVLTCEDGRWKSFTALPKCFASCGPFPLLPGGAYSMGGDVGGLGIEGETLEIRCAESADILSPVSRQTVQCRAGKWDALQVKCGATCAPLGPVLGPRYRVFMEDRLGNEARGPPRPGVPDGGGRDPRGGGRAPENCEAKEGERRVVLCAPGTSKHAGQKRDVSRGRGDGEDAGEEALCGKDGWSKVRMQCFADCPAEQLVAVLAQHGPGLQWSTHGEEEKKNDGDPGKHGELRTVSCAPGFLPSTARSSFTTTCDDGKWQPLSPSSFSSSPLCVPRCPTLNLPVNAYVVSALPDAIGPDGALQQRLQVSCAAHAVSVSSDKQQTLVCSREGVWSLLTVQCQAPCAFPLLQLGDRYELREQEDRGPDSGSHRSSGVSAAPRGGPPTPDSAGDEVYRHGTELMIGCASGAAADGGGAAASPHKIVCSDGVWKSAYRVIAAAPGASVGSRSDGRQPGGSTDTVSREPSRRGELSGPSLGGIFTSGASPSSSASAFRQSEIELKCRRGCGVPALPPELRPLFLTPRVALLQRWHHEQQLQVTCAKGFSADPGRLSEADEDAFETLVCRDGAWHSIHSASIRNMPEQNRLAAPPAIPGIRLACHRSCEASEIRRTAQLHHFDVPTSFAVSSPSFPTSSLPHAGTVAVSCQPGFSALAGPPSGASLRCMYGSVALPHTVCGHPSCTDGVQNGDETGVDCGGSHCAPCASCGDGVQNNGETGVDCGGPCPACVACSAPVPSQFFAPGFEPDLDALGALLVLPPPSPAADSAEQAASTLRQFLPFSEFLSQVRADFSSAAGGFPSGSAIHLHCSHATGSPHSPSPALASRHWAVFRCVRGQWLAATERPGAQAVAALSGSGEGSGTSAFSCVKPTCSDGARNGDETGVDCGGSCPQACPSCFNGLRDGDEEDVDCGGSACEPCEFCSPRPLKEFLGDRDLFVVRRAGPHGKRESSAFEKHVDRLLAEGIVASALTKPGEQLHIKCKARSGDDGLLVQCRNGIWALAAASAASSSSAWTSSFSSFFGSSRGAGMWWPKQAAEASQALAALRLSCLATHSLEASPLEGADTSTLSKPSSSSPSSLSSSPSLSSSSSRPSVQLTWRVGGSLAAFAVPDIGVTREGSAHPPCIARLLEVFQSSLRGECGALAFGSSALKLSSFCSNSCMRGLKGALAAVLGESLIKDERRGRDEGDKGSRALPFFGCSSAEEGLLAQKIATLLRELIGTWCAQQNGLYCFADAAASFHFLRSMYIQAETTPALFLSELKGHCPANSCFRSNAKHVLILAELSELVDIRLPAFPTGGVGKEALSGPTPRALRSAAYSRSAAYNRSVRRLEDDELSGGGTDDAWETAREATEAGQGGTGLALKAISEKKGETNSEGQQRGERRGDGARLAGAEEFEFAQHAEGFYGVSESTFETYDLSAGHPRRLFPSSSPLSPPPVAPLVLVDLRQRSSSGATSNRSGSPGLSGGSSGTPGLQMRGTQGFLEDIRNTPEILDLLCIEVNGQSCAEDVLRVGLETPVFASPSGNEGAQKICRSDSCLLEVTRVFGQMLIDRADRQTEDFFEKRIFHMPPTRGRRNHALESNGAKPGDRGSRSAGVRAPGDGAGAPVGMNDFHPYDVILGVLMKHWGRTFCHRNIRGSLCGGFVFPSSLDTALAEQSRGSYVPTENEKKYRTCSCPHTLIGDGDCDLQCFNEACGWDGGDCLATEVLFPVYRHLVSQLGTEIADSCNPFNARFSCNGSDASSSRTPSSTTRRNCSHQFSRLADARGCCLATQLEVLRDLLDADTRILRATGNLLSSARVSTPSSSSAVVGGTLRERREAQQGRREEAEFPRVPAQLWKGDTWIQVDRSSAFFEFACKRQLDRTCSRGLNRFAYAVDMKITNIDLDTVLHSSTASAFSQTSSVVSASSATPSALSSLVSVSSPFASSPLAASPPFASSLFSSSAHLDGEAEPHERSSSVRASNLPLSATLSPKHRELLRVLREELAALFAVPVGDVVEMRLWRGSIDVSAVVDPGWLANTARFKDRLQALTEDLDAPASIVSLLSAALTRHLSADSHASPLLAVLPTWPAQRLLAALPEDETRPVALSPFHTKVSQIPFQTTLPSSLPAASRPVFGTFGVSELPFSSRACVGTQGLLPPEETSVYDAYKIWANSGRGGVGNEHGSTMVVECNTGHEAVEGEAPQTLICNQGRWEPLPPASSNSGNGAQHRILMCRRPCQPYEKIDPAVMRPEFIVSGYGTTDGDTRTVLCAPGYSPRDVETSGATETIACVNGDWKPLRRLLCEKDFAALSGSSSSPCSGALSGLEESYRLTEVPLIPASNPDVSADLAAALKIRLQPHGTTVQVFKVTCARGYTHAPVQSGGSSGVPEVAASQTTRSGSGKNNAEVFLACLNGGIVGLGSDELFPLGGSAEGHRAEALAENFTERLRKAIPVKVPSRSHVMGMGTVQEDALSVHQSMSRERPSVSPALPVSGSEEASDIQKSLACLRDIRLDPPVGAKPISDTAMVFLCLLILFVLVVALIAGWWMKNSRKKRKAGKLAGSEAGKNGDGDSHGDADEVESKQTLDFKRRTTGETVMMDGTVTLSGAGVEQFLTNYLLGTGGTKLLAGDASGRSRDGLPPGAVILGRLKEDDLLAAQMYIDQAHAETSPSFAKPSELLTPATAAMVLGTTEAQQALLLLQQQRERGHVTGRTRGTTRDGELLVDKLRELRRHTGGHEAMEEVAERRAGQDGTTAYSLSPIYLKGLPGDSGSVQDVREQSVTEDASQSTVASGMPRSTTRGNHHQQLHVLFEPGRNPLGLRMDEEEEGSEQVHLDQDGTDIPPDHGVGTTGAFPSSGDPRQHDFSQTIPQQQNNHTLRYLRQYEQALMEGRHLGAWPTDGDEKGVEAEVGEILDVDTRAFGTGSPSLSFRHASLNTRSKGCAYQQPRHPDSHHVSGMSQELYTGETQETCEGNGESGRRMSDDRERNVIHGISEWESGAECRHLDTRGVNQSRMRSSSGPHGFAATSRPTAVTGRRHSVHLHHPDLKTNSSNAESSTQEFHASIYAGVSQSSAVHPQQQMVFSSQSDDELYPDDSASCVGQHGYRLGRGLAPMLLMERQKPIAEHGARSEPSNSPNILNKNQRLDHKDDAFLRQTFPQGPLTTNPSWTGSTASQGGGR